MAGKKGAKPLEFRNTQLADALQTQDMAAVAFALRHGPTVVPLMKPGQRDNPLDVRFNSLGAEGEAAIKEAVHGKPGFKLEI